MLESRAERSTLDVAPDIEVVHVGLNFLSENLTELLKNHTSKQSNGPSAISASDFAQQEACFDLHKQARFFFCDLTEI